MTATQSTTRRPLLAVRDIRAGLRRWESTAALILIAVTFSTVHAATPNIIGIDGYYHVKVAALMWQQGWRLFFPLDFPWLQLTILGPGHYSDHHFLFHVLQAPFTQGDLRVGAKMAAVLFGTLGLYTVYAFLARQGVRYPLLWIALLIASAPTFIWRQSMARPQSLFLALLVGAIWAVFAGRPRLLLPLGFLAVWLFDGFPFVLGVPAAAVAAHLVHRLLDRAVNRCQVRCWRSTRLAVAAFGWALLGVALGLLLHPYVPRNLEFAYLHLLPKAVPSEQLDVPVGQEWYPFSVRGFVTRVGPVAALTLLGLVPPLLALTRRRAPAWRTVMLGGIAIGFMVMAARSQRLIEYFPAFAVLFCAWSWAHCSSTGLADLSRLLRGAWARVATRLGHRRPCAAALSDRPAADGAPRSLGLARRFASVGSRFRGGLPEHVGRSARLVAWWPRLAGGVPAQVSWSAQPVGWRSLIAAFWPWLAGAALVPALFVSIGVARRDAGNGLPWDTYRDAARWLAANTPAGSRVFTTDWDDFPHMFFWNTHNTYLAGLDPTYMSLYDPGLYRRWRDVTSGRAQHPSRVIRQEFGARYVVSDRERKHEAFLRAAADDPGLEVVLRTEKVVLFRVRDAQD